jgi:hypothetical protein
MQGKGFEPMFTGMTRSNIGNYLFCSANALFRRKPNILRRTAAMKTMKIPIRRALFLSR